MQPYHKTSDRRAIRPCIDRQSRWILIVERSCCWGSQGLCTLGLGPGDRVLGGEATGGEIIHLPGKGGEPCNMSFWPASPDLCPTSKTKTRQRIEPMLTQLEAAQKRHNVSVRSGHVLGMSHRPVVFTEAPNVEAVRDFVMETGLVQWNSVGS